MSACAVGRTILAQCADAKPHAVNSCAGQLFAELDQSFFAAKLQFLPNCRILHDHIELAAPNLARPAVAGK